MLKTYIWMAIFLGLNLGGFIIFLVRTSRIEAEQARRERDGGRSDNQGG
jgi:hypothetical protein